MVVSSSHGAGWYSPEVVPSHCCVASPHHAPRRPGVTTTQASMVNRRTSPHFWSAGVPTKTTLPVLPGRICKPPAGFGEYHDDTSGTAAGGVNTSPPRPPNRTDAAGPSPTIRTLWRATNTGDPRLYGSPPGR